MADMTTHRDTRADAADNTLSFQETVRARRSYRGFLSQPLPDALIAEVLQDAQLAPSNCNTQPWNVHIVSGAKRDELSRILMAKSEAGQTSPDFSFDMSEFYGCYGERKDAHSKAYYEIENVMRDDAEGRRRVASRNYTFFNAPHVALLFMPSFGDNVRTAGDIGMYGQTFLLSLAARGVGGIPLTSLGQFAETIREVLGISAKFKMLFGIAFGYPDEAAPSYRRPRARADIGESVTFHT